MAVSRSASTLAFTQGQVIYMKDLGSLGVQHGFVQIRRDSRLTAVAVSDDGLTVASGDEVGKIYYVSNPQGSSSLIVQTFHWHASQVRWLVFMRNAPVLMSGGNEGVIVQWHLEKQEKTFVSQIGNAILNLSLSPTYYVVTLANNSVKVLRTDNNKLQTETKGIDLTEVTSVSSFDTNLVVTCGTQV